MEVFAEYNVLLEQVFHLWTQGSDEVFANNGNVTAAKVRELVDISSLRASGVFFTGDDLAAKAVESLNPQVGADSFIVDPTCGSGSLLIAASKKLDIRQSASETLEIWGRQLCGVDIYPQFVQCTKLRLVLEALLRGALPDKPLGELLDLLVNIQVGNCLDKTEVISRATHFLFNPPYNNSGSAVRYFWATGKVSNAAIYYFELSRVLAEGCCVAAILPDVLRSGSRFSAWRSVVSEGLTSAKISIEGRFDSKTDIDIFVMSGVVTKAGAEGVQWQSFGAGAEPCVGDFFDVSVGAVVPYRDPHEGANYAYIHPKTLPKWGEVSKIFEKRRFLGRVFQPPFVAVRRTSGPRDKHRVVPTLVLGRRLVAVENHLLVLSPKSGDVDCCKRLLQLFRQESVNGYLNSRIRCRHLTVSAVSEVPWRTL